MLAHVVMLNIMITTHTAVPKLCPAHDTFVDTVLTGTPIIYAAYLIVPYLTEPYFMKPCLTTACSYFQVSKAVAGNLVLIEGVDSTITKTATVSSTVLHANVVPSPCPLCVLFYAHQV